MHQLSHILLTISSCGNLLANSARGSQHNRFKVNFLVNFWQTLSGEYTRVLFLATFLQTSTVLATFWQTNRVLATFLQTTFCSPEDCQQRQSPANNFYSFLANYIVCCKFAASLRQVCSKHFILVRVILSFVCPEIPKRLLK